MLGPVRFEHIETCAREVCRSFVLKEQVEDAIITLTTLDSILLTLREELVQLRPPDSATPTNDLKPKKPQDYSTLRNTLDIKKAKRLVTARENSVKSVKASIAKLKDQTTIMVVRHLYLPKSYLVDLAQDESDPKQNIQTPS